MRTMRNMLNPGFTSPTTAFSMDNPFFWIQRPLFLCLVGCRRRDAPPSLIVWGACPYTRLTEHSLLLSPTTHLTLAAALSFVQSRTATT